jgi:hypothetical protein
MAELQVNLDNASTPGWLRRRCQVIDEAVVARACGSGGKSEVEAAGRLRV